MKTQSVALGLIAVAAAAAGFLLATLLNPATEPSGGLPVGAAHLEYPDSDDLVGRPRPDFTHYDSSGAEVSADDFEGQVLLINFWASWCKPCVEEMPMLSRLATRLRPQGLAVIGIALDDPGRAIEFAESLDLSYPVLVGQTDVVLTGRRYGNRTGMLPFSALVDAGGIVRWLHLGALDAVELESRIVEIL
jgi:thiol-disulfide isomerase/thioredoxin